MLQILMSLSRAPLMTLLSSNCTHVTAAWWPCRVSWQCPAGRLHTFKNNVLTCYKVVLLTSYLYVGKYMYMYISAHAAQQQNTCACSNAHVQMHLDSSVLRAWYQLIAMEMETEYSITVPSAMRRPPHVKVNVHIHVQMAYLIKFTYTLAHN